MTDTKLEVAFGLVVMNNQVNEAVEEFVNPDNLLELPDAVHEAMLEFSSARRKLADATLAWLEGIR